MNVSKNRMRNWLTVVLVGIAALVCAPAVRADALCTPYTCKPQTKHSIWQLTTSDGMGHYKYLSNVDDAGLYAAAQQACVDYAAAHSDSTKTVSFNGTCYPVLPLKTYGGQSGSIDVAGVSTTTYARGGSSSSPGTWALLDANCTDTLASDGQCYCRAQADWITVRQACAYTIDRFHAPDQICPKFGDPIAPLVGAAIANVDLGLRVGKENLALAYDSRSKVIYLTPPSNVNGAVAAASYPPSALGALWTTSAHKSLYVQRQSGSTNVGFVVQAYRGDGQFITFTHPTTTSYVASSPLVRAQLVPVLDGSGNQTSQVRLIDTNGTIELYDMYNINSSLRADLLSITYPAGGAVNFTYSTATTPVALAPATGLLISMADQQGRTVKFTYRLDGATTPLLRQVTAPDGAAINFQYDASQNLTKVIWPDGKFKTIVYERSDLPWAVTGVIDEKSTRLSTYTYDNDGRAIDTQEAGGINHYSVRYATPPAPYVVETLSGNVYYRDHYWGVPDGTSITLPNGEESSLGAVSIGGGSVMSAQSQPAGSGCLASTNGATYDANGNVLSKDDFDGRRTCYAYDSSNRETVRVEGLANTVACSSVTPSGSTLPTGSRKITTAWHPDWRLPTQVKRPLSVSTSVYHGQPDPFNGNSPANCTTALNLPNGKPMPVACKQVQQATLADGTIDTSVASRLSSSTYDSAGRELSSVDPNGHTTTFSYFTDTSFSSNNPDGSFDSNFAYVSLLLHGNDANGSTAFVDSSGVSRPVTALGSAHISSANSKFGGTSMAFNGSGDALSTTGLADFTLGTGDFTVEFWAYKSADGGNGYDKVVNTYTTTSGNNGWWLELSSSRGFVFGGPSGSGAALYAQYNTNPNDSTWHHWAASRSGGTLRLFKDGVVVATASNTTNFPAATITIGGGSVVIPYYFSGYIDELRVTKGLARYTANFTPPTSEFPDHDALVSAADTGHATGDLQTITNAAGQVTQFTQYDRAGRVRQMSDAKGTVTEYTYTPRGAVSTVTVTPPAMSARTSSYSYDDAGLLTGVTQPDGTTLSYSYDGAQRLTGITDARGNSVTYTLDNVGNRIGEDVKDPGGTLMRSISRSFDALNRLQQVSGALR